MLTDDFELAKLKNEIRLCISGQKVNVSLVAMQSVLSSLFAGLMNGRSEEEIKGCQDILLLGIDHLIKSHLNEARKVQSDEVSSNVVSFPSSALPNMH